MRKTFMLLPALILTIPATGFSMDFMSGDDIKNQFNDMTFDVHFLPKDKNFSAFSSQDGNLIIERPSGRDPKRSWFVNDKGQRCVTHPNWKNHKQWKNGRCFNAAKQANGEVYMYSLDGEHTHVFTNFRQGNQL